MTVITNGRGKVSLRLTPKGRLAIYWLPRPYRLTRQQKKVQDCARACNIRKGMPRSELVEKMGSCIRPCMTGPVGLEREIRLAQEAREKVTQFSQEYYRERTRQDDRERERKRL